MPQARTAHASETPEVRQAIAALQRLAEAFALRRGQLAAEAGLTEARWRLLEEVAGDDFLPSMFARRRDCSPAAVSRGLRGLLDAGLVEASIGARDARERHYRLTRRGCDVLRRLRRQRQRATQAVWRRFDARQLREFAGFATALSEGLEAYAERRKP